VDPDILLLDEVLQTGDNTFKEKSRRRIAEVLQTAKAVVMVTHDMSWITAFCNRAILMDKGKIVADGDPEEIADLHEQDAAKRARQKRKAKQLLKHGKVDLVDIRRARRQGKLDQLVEGHEDDYQALKAEKQRQLQESRAKRRAAKQARKTKQQEAEAAGRRSNDGAAPARTGATTDDTEPNAEPAASGSAEPAASGSAERTPPSA
jgi:ABC-type multidrug transport system ATPase subunit